MSKIRTYFENWDSGFAPYYNSKENILSLACCKNQLRNRVIKGDWVFGFAADPVLSRIVTSLRFNILKNCKDKKINHRLVGISNTRNSRKGASGNYREIEEDVFCLYKEKENQIDKIKSCQEITLLEKYSKYVEEEEEAKYRLCDTKLIRNFDYNYLEFVCRVYKVLGQDEYYKKGINIPECTHGTQWCRKCDEKCMGDNIYNKSSKSRNWFNVRDNIIPDLTEKMKKQTGTSKRQTYELLCKLNKLSSNWNQLKNINHDWGNIHSDVTAPVIISKEFWFFGREPYDLDKENKLVKKLGYFQEKRNGKWRNNKVSVKEIEDTDRDVIKIFKNLKKHPKNKMIKKPLMWPDCNDFIKEGKDEYCSKVRCFTHQD
jgi:hypothetical protein